MLLPSYVVEVLNTLRHNGNQAFVVGGCIRDVLMGRVPTDYDVATSATPEVTVSLFQKTVPIGEKHGTIAVLVDGGTVEVSTFKGYKTEVEPSLYWDLLYRDFTVNAMAIEENGELYDPFGGQEDIKNKVIKSPENKSRERFSEDPLRMMRAIRFCSTHGFLLHPTVTMAITELHDAILTVSFERIREELNRILTSDLPSLGIGLLLKTGLLAHILPEAIAMVDFNQRSIWHDKDIYQHTMAVIEAVPPRLNVRLAALMHDIGKPMTFTVDENGVGHFYEHQIEGGRITKNIMRRLKYDNQTIEDVTILVTEHMSRFFKVRNASLKRLINRVGDHNLVDLFDLQRADTIGSAPPFNFSELDAMQAGINHIYYEKPPMKVKDLAVNGNDLMGIGFKPGPEMGRVLEALLKLVLDDPKKNDRNILLNHAIKHRSESVSPQEDLLSIEDRGK